MGATAIFKMLPSILLLVFLITVESTPNSNVTRALPPRYLDVQNFQKCMVDLVIPGGQPDYCIPLSQPDDCPKRVWRNLKRAYKDRKKRSPQSGDTFEPSQAIPVDAPPPSASFGAPAPSAPAPRPRVCIAENSEACQFPLTYKTKAGYTNTYNQCTLDDTEDDKAWCKTTSGKWKNCNPGCPGYVPPCTAYVPVAGGNRLVKGAWKFPFPHYFGGFTNTYSSCTTDDSDNNKAWCETINGFKKDCNPGCDYNPNPNPRPDPPRPKPRPDPRPPGSKDVRLENGIPEVYINGQFYPICGHYFWDNDNGADLFCRELSYQYRSGEITHGRRGVLPQRLNKDAVSIGKCYKDDILKSCTGGGCNNLQIGGECPGLFGRGRCTAGARAGIKIRCSTKERQEKKTKRVKLIDKMPYVWRSGKWVPICGHYFWDNHNGAKLFCEELGFPEGRLIGGTYGAGSVTLPEDALKIGKCNSGDSWLGCTGECNDLEIGGYCRPLGQVCTAGSKFGVQIRCTGVPRYKRAIDPIGPIPPIIGEIDGLAPKYQRCLKDYYPPGQSSSKCLPAIRPDNNCTGTVYNELLQQIFQ